MIRKQRPERNPFEQAFFQVLFFCNKKAPWKTKGQKRMTGVEPASKAWEAFILPMNYIRRNRSHFSIVTIIPRTFISVKSDFVSKIFFYFTFFRSLSYFLRDLLSFLRAYYHQQIFFRMRGMRDGKIYYRRNRRRPTGQSEDQWVKKCRFAHTGGVFIDKGDLRDS